MQICANYRQVVRLVLPIVFSIIQVLSSTSHAAAQTGAVVRPEARKEAESAGQEFFEKRIRPVLAQSCYSCHSVTAKRMDGDLVVDSRAALLKGGKHGPAIVPGDPDHSLLVTLFRPVANGAAPGHSGVGSLAPRALADLSEWVRQGARWPAETHVGPASDNRAADRAKRSHWAWQPVRRPKLPAVRDIQWPKTGIDRFLLAKLESNGVKPNSPADRRTLIRRAYFDMIGLPPTMDEVQAFVMDTAPNAWDKVVDRLLANPHYGERWGRYWLDVARYGEDQAHSFQPRLYPQGFRYRDWVAHALNADMPYDRFVKEQIAADLLNEPDQHEQLPALGFFATGPVYYGDEKMYDQYDDRIDTLSRGFLGLTAACARCHDHKFDPITQKDYYGLAGIFASTNYVEVPFEKTGAGPGGDRQKTIDAKQNEVDRFVNEQAEGLRRRLAPQIANYLTAVWKLQNRRKAAPGTPLEGFAASEKLYAVEIERWEQFLSRDGEEEEKKAEATAFASANAWRTLVKSQDQKKDLSASSDALAAVRKASQAVQDQAMELIGRHDAKVQNKPGAAALTGAENRVVERLVGGEGVLTIPRDRLDSVLVGDDKGRLAELTRELERLKMGPFIHALADAQKAQNVKVLLRGNQNSPGDEAPRRFFAILSHDDTAFTKGSGRLELAEAIASRSNPLTARVMVNRLWQHHFGRGLVRTTSNFGLLGEPPTHPELLDYLASRFMEQNWSVKAVHREILLSSAYRMSSRAAGRGQEIDPDDRLLWRMLRQRLDIEAWRDTMLAVTGKLDLTIGGPSVSLSDTNNNRRTFYASVSRHDLDALLRLFDFPDPNVTSDNRMNTTVPLQQLFVLNGEFMVQQAKSFAAMLNAIPGATNSSRIRRAYQLAYNRAPSDRELALALAFVGDARGPITVAHQTPESRLTRWEQFAQALLGSNEFLYID